MKKISAPIDNKNLMEDPFEDEVFRDFYAAYDHRKNNRRHLIGHKTVKDMFGMDCEDGIVDVAWHYGDASITITLLAVPGTEDWENTRDYIFEDYRRTFKAWECPENEGLRVKFYELRNQLNVIFYYECE